jgi:transcriptional regulator with XRE-family HTH domain
MAEVGAKLRAIRQQWQLSLRDVEQHSRLIAQQRGDLSYQVSASWLAHLESDEHELTVNKLIALAEVYGITTDRLLHSIYPGDERPLVLDQLASPNETFPDRLPDETTLVPASNGPSRVPYRVGIIGRVDLTLEPVIPAGSIVQIDTSKREISPKKDWTHEFQRPIYFLLARDGYFCGWCELDENSHWLTLIPHPLSSLPSRTWRYGTEVQNLGRVISVVIRQENEFNC